MPTKRGKAQAKGQAAVNAALAARGGMSRSDLMSDQDRGPVSGLGYGTGSKKEKLRAQAFLRGRKDER